MHRTYPVRHVDVSIVSAEGRTIRSPPRTLRPGVRDLCRLEIIDSSPTVAAEFYGRALKRWVNAAPRVTGVVTDRCSQLHRHGPHPRGGRDVERGQRPAERRELLKRGCP